MSSTSNTPTQCESQPVSETESDSCLSSQTKKRKRIQIGANLKHSREEHPPDAIKWTFAIDGLHGTRELSAFSEDTRQSLEQSFAATYNPGPKRATAAFYEVTVRRERRAYYAGQGRCIQMRIYEKKRQQFLFNTSSGDRRWACDSCIRTRRLCARLLLHGGEYKLCFHPIPQHLREGIAWTDMAYWLKAGSSV
jgi:hypothetical protein